MKKTLSLLLSFALLLGTSKGFAAPAFAEENTGVTAYCCDSGLYKDANFTEGPIGIDSNGDESFRGSVTKIVFKNGTTAINHQTFEDCTALEDLTLPAGIKSIGSEAFSGCTGLTDLTLPGSLRSIGNGAFFGCHYINSITIPSSVTSIDALAFAHCWNVHVIFEGTTPPSFGSDIFHEDTSPLILVPNKDAIASYKSVLNSSWYDDKIKALALDQQTGISEVPDGLKNTAFNSPAKIEAQMKASVKASMSGVDEANIVVYDISLRASSGNGDSGEVMTEDTIPSDGVTVLLPYPTGTNKDNFDFVITHMFTTGTKAGSTEIITPEKTANGLQFTLHSLSPVAVGYKAISNSNSSSTTSTTSSSKPASKPASTVSSSTTNNNPQTGDSNNAMLFIPLISGAALCGAIILYIRKKQQKV